jgi:hypothetical protein
MSVVGTPNSSDIPATPIIGSPSTVVGAVAAPINNPKAPAKRPGS